MTYLGRAFLLWRWARGRGRGLDKMGDLMAQFGGWVRVQYRHGVPGYRSPPRSQCKGTVNGEVNGGGNSNSVPREGKITSSRPCVPAMTELVATLEKNANARHGDGECEALAQLARVFAFEDWDGRDPTKSKRYWAAIFGRAAA